MLKYGFRMKLALAREILQLEFGQKKAPGHVQFNNSSLNTLIFLVLYA
jgi:hypothetical protein